MQRPQCILHIISLPALLGGGNYAHVIDVQMERQKVEQGRKGNPDPCSNHLITLCLKLYHSEKWFNFINVFLPWSLVTVQHCVSVSTQRLLQLRL